MLNEAISLAGGSEVANNAEAYVMLTLYLDGPQRPRDLTALTGLTRGGTTNLIDRLEPRGLVTRTAAPADRRGFLIEITSRGTEMMHDMARAVNRVLTFASPLIDSWKDHLVADGYELGRRWHPRSDAQTLEHVRQLTSAGLTIVPAYRAAFGHDDPSPYLTLHVLLLATEPGGTRPSRVGDATSLSSSRVSDLLGRMEQGDLVTRITGAASDRRVTIVTATERGRAALDVIVDRCEVTVQATADVFFPRSQPGGARRS